MKNISDGVGNWFSKWSSEENKTLLFETLDIYRHKIIRIWIDLKHTSEKGTASSLNHVFNKQENNYLFLDDIDYFKESYNTIGRYSKNDFLSFINFPRNSKTKKIKGIKFFISGIPAYSFIASVSDLLETCYVFRRRGNKLGYQRALKYSRISEIANNIKNNKIIAFPNSIIINSESKLSQDNYKIEDCPEIDKIEDCPEIVDISLPISYCELKVVDGQHRLLGFSKLDKSLQENSYLPTIAFDKMDHQKEIRMFIDINSKQKKVDRNLVLLLKTDFEWNPTEKEYYEKMAVIIALKLQKNGPLRKKIYTGQAGEKRKDKVTLSTIVSILHKNGFIKYKYPLWQKKYDDINTPIKNTNEILKNINTKLKQHKIKNQTFFLTNVGLRIIFKFISIIQKNIILNKISVNYEEIFIDLNEVIEEQIEDIRSSYGEGGASKTAKYLCKKLKDSNAKYIQLEIDQRKLKIKR